jgi:copper chaperone CopZ
VLSDRNCLKKVGQEEVVKLFPKPASKGLGSASEEAVEADGAEEDVDAARLRNCCIYGSGGVLLSKRSTLSVLVSARVACSSLLFGVDAASTRGLQKHKRMIKQTSVDATLETSSDFLTQFRHAVCIECEYEVSSTKEALKSVDVAASGSIPTVKSFRHLGKAPHLFIPGAAS